MFCSNNDGYMQDLYYYNQMPNNTYLNSYSNGMNLNPNIQMMGNNNMPVNNFGMQNNFSVQNLNSLYPSIYRIINPVVSKVVSNNNQPINENLINNMADTIYNIVEGQVDFGVDEQIQKNQLTEENISSISSNTNQGGSTRNSVNKNFSQNNQASFKNTKTCESLLRDLIKILIIKELLSKNQMQRQFYQYQYYNSQPFFMNM